MKHIPMPPRRSMADKVVRAASKSIFLAAMKHFETSRIIDVGEIVSGGTPSTTNSELWDGDIVWITPKDLGRPRNIEIDSSERTISPKGTNRLLPVGTVLFSSRAPIGHVGIAAIELCTNQGFKNIICSSKIYNRYLFHVLRANIEELDDMGHGNTFKEIPAKVLAEFEIPVPSISLQKEIGDLLDVLYLRQAGEKFELPELSSPLTEQRRIVAHIEALAARVNEAQRLREEADLESELLFASYLKATRHQLLESDFPKKKIGDIATVTSGGTPSRDNPMYWNGDIPWIKTGELIDGDIYDSEEYITEEGMKNSSARLFPPETILIALYGQGQTRGRTARLMIDATTNQACCAILPTPEILDSRFTQYWQRSLYYEMREKSHGGAQPNWNGGMIKNIEIALPPLDKQRRIVDYLDGLQAKVNALRGLQSQSQEELDALLPSVLDRAFKGELLADIEHKNTSVKYAALEIPYTPGVLHRSPKIVLVSKNCLLGAIAGDMVGQRYEHHRATHERFPLFTERSHFTDDTVLTLAVADGILHGGEYLKSIVEYAKRYPNAGYGGYFRDWLHANEHEPYNSFGNGSAMRVSPIGWAFDTVDDVLREAERSAAVTHNHPEGIKGAQAVALSIFRARNGASKEDIRAEIQERFGYDMSRTLAEIAPVYEWDVTCQKSVPESIIAFLESTDYESAIRNAIMLGGDADTMAAIAGSIAEAYYGGVPAEIAEEVMKRLTPDLKSTLEEFGKRFGTKIIE